MLIVDDNAEHRSLYRLMLDDDPEFEWEFVETETGGEGIARCLDTTFDAVALDYILPDMNGLEFLEALRKVKDHLPPVVMITGQGSKTVAREALEHGARGYLVKDLLEPDPLHNAFYEAMKANKV